MEKDEKIGPHCRRNPPQPFAVPVKHPISGQNNIAIEPLPNPLYPHGVCGEFKQKLTIEK